MMSAPMLIAVYVMIIFILCDESVSQNGQTPENPCPDIFKYIFDGYEYYGIITQSNTSETRREIKIGMTQPGVLDQDYKGKISLNIDLNKISDYVNLSLPITYRVDFPQVNVLPRVTDITDNGIKTCSGPKDSSPRAEINMKIVLEEKIQSEKLWSLNLVCGGENDSITRLRKRAVFGEAVSKSRFPWIAAIYQKKNNGRLTCSKPEEILVSLGRHNLNDYQGGMNIDVSSIIIHPDYRAESGNFDGSVAIVQLARSVTFAHAIRPICLWEGPSDLDLIKGVSGAIVGWGVDETYTVSPLPKLVEVTIARTVDCLRSNEAFVHLTSNRTLCAGKRDGSGPCIGDSGNGLMIKKGSKWVLRGIASAGLATSGRECNLHEYVVYADIAKFIDWIKEFMLE